MRRRDLFAVVAGLAMAPKVVAAVQSAPVSSGPALWSYHGPAEMHEFYVNMVSNPRFPVWSPIGDAVKLTRLAPGASLSAGVQCHPALTINLPGDHTTVARDYESREDGLPAIRPVPVLSSVNDVCGFHAGIIDGETT